MSNITITPENFKRFAKRLQKQHEEQGFKTTLTQTQEILAKTFGASSYFELNSLLEKQEPEVDNFHNSATDLTTRLFKTALGQPIPNYKEFNNAQKTLKTAFTLESPNSKNLINDFVHDILDEAYTVYSDEGIMKKKYEINVSKEIDAILNKNNIDTNGISWWSIVHTLIELKEIKLAEIAQFHAQPTLNDLVPLIDSTSKISDLYRNQQLETGENVIQYFRRSIIEVLQHIYNNPIDRKSNTWYNLIPKH